jgi:excisionase family DNA binding protein
VLTGAEAAELLQVEPDVVLELAGAGELPGRLLGGEWRFARSALLAWLAHGDAARPRRPSPQNAAKTGGARRRSGTSETDR